MGAEGRAFEITGVDPKEIEFALAGHRAVFEGFYYAEITVVEVGVFPH